MPKPGANIASNNKKTKAAKDTGKECGELVGQTDQMIMDKVRGKTMKVLGKEFNSKLQVVKHFRKSWETAYSKARNKELSKQWLKDKFVEFLRSVYDNKSITIGTPRKNVTSLPTAQPSPITAERAKSGSTARSGNGLTSDGSTSSGGASSSTESNKRKNTSTPTDDDDQKMEWRTERDKRNWKDKVPMIGRGCEVRISNLQGRVETDESYKNNPAEERVNAPRIVIVKQVFTPDELHSISKEVIERAHARQNDPTSLMGLEGIADDVDEKHNSIYSDSRKQMKLLAHMYEKLTLGKDGEEKYEQYGGYARKKLEKECKYVIAPMLGVLERVRAAVMANMPYHKDANVQPTLYQQVKLALIISKANGSTQNKNGHSDYDDSAMDEAYKNCCPPVSAFLAFSDGATLGLNSEDLREGEKALGYEVGDVVCFSMDFNHYGTTYEPRTEGDSDMHYRLFFSFGNSHFPNVVQFAEDKEASAAASAPNKKTQ